MDRKYNLKLDLQFRCNNQTMKFNQFDNNTSDFFMKISSGGKSFDVEKAIVVLAAIKPSGKVSSQFIEVENGLVYADLKNSMKDEIGTYTAQAMLILEDERVVTDPINYEVEEDKIFSLLNDTVEATEDFTLLTDMLNRLSIIEISEEQRQINEAERILSEENRKIEEAKRVEAELVRQHEEADRSKYDATRESNENTRKQNESIRLANETNRIDEEAKRVEEENKRKLAEEERNANYNFMTEDEERRRSEANAHKEAENLRVQAETNRVNEEAKRRTTEQARVSAENTRVDNENVRKANEETRQNNETKRVEAETQRQDRYNSFITEAEANADNFENYTNNAKASEEERKASELDRKTQEDRRISNEVERISNENTRKANEVVREKNEASRQDVFENKVNEVDEKISELNTTKDNFISSVNTKVDNKISELDNAKTDMSNTVSNKIDEVENRFNALTSKQQQDAEVIDARDNEVSLKARLDRDIEKTNKELDKIKKLEESTVSTVETESDFTTVEATSNGYFEDVKLEGKTLVNIHPKDTPAFSASDKTNPKYNIITKENYIKVTGSDLEATNYRYVNMGKLNFEMFKPNTTYTLVFTKLKGVNMITLQNGDSSHPLVANTVDTQDDKLVYTLVTKEALVKSKQILYLWLNSNSTTVDIEVENPMIFEGDLTTNPPSGYMEGIKSVGQSASEDGADEIVVSSVNENLFDGNFTIEGNLSRSSYINVKGNDKVTINLSTSYEILDVNKLRIFNDWTETGIIQIPKNGHYLKFWKYTTDIEGLDIQVNRGGKIKSYTPHQSDKKRLLYYNNETQSWEKPILREWDSIEKHTDGKYYYHQRSGEVVLNGSEGWGISKTSENMLIIGRTPNTSIKGNNGATCNICDKFISVGANFQWLNEIESVAINKDGQILIQISKSKLSTQDEQGFKKWLQANNVTVVYQLAQEKVYECTNIDLITYANETNYVVESGAIVPRTTLKVHNNISNVVSLLQKKVSLLESNITSYMITQNRLMLASRYNADNVTFKVDYPSMMSEREVEIDYDLFKLIQDNIIVGPENYDVDKMLEIMDLYAMIGFITWEMWDYLYEVIDSQINPVIEDLEGTPEI